MFAIKVIGSIMIISGTTYYGYYMAYRQITRIKWLIALKESILMIQGQIQFAYMKMPEVLLDIAKKSRYEFIKDFYNFVGERLNDKYCEDFSCAWNEGMDMKLNNLFFTDSDCEIIRNIGNMPLNMDADMQIKLIDETILQLEGNIKYAQETLLSKCKVYKCIGFTAGFVIVLVLI